MDAVHHEQWLQTTWVEWDFDGRQQHLWDKERHFARVRWKNNEVLLNLHSLGGIAKVNGHLVMGSERQDLIAAAWAHWANDSFWLNPISKLFDEGTRRGLVSLEEGRQGLMVTYDSGGVTPGDSYLWMFDENFRPTAWKMWVGILPIGGLETSWEDWIESETGALFATKHQIKVLRLEITGIKTGQSWQNLNYKTDPFEELVANL